MDSQYLGRLGYSILPPRLFDGSDPVLIINPCQKVPLFDIFTAKDQLVLSSSRQISPLAVMLGWYMRVMNLTFGGAIGYVGGNVILTVNRPPSYGLFSLDGVGVRETRQRKYRAGDSGGPVE